MSGRLVPVDPDEFPELAVVLRCVAQSGRGGRFKRLDVICEGPDGHVLGRVFQTAAGFVVAGAARQVEDRGKRFDGWGAPPGGVRTVGKYSRVPVAYRLAGAASDELVRLQCGCRDVSIPAGWILGEAASGRRAVFHAVQPG